MKIWIALNIGNSRLHWALFEGQKLWQAWDTPHLTAAEIKALVANRDQAQKKLPFLLHHYLTSEVLPLWVASVSPEQTSLWQTYPGVKIFDLDQVPLQCPYPTLGIDRALAIWGGGQAYGWPILVIDAGTALTFTGADANRRLIGGAILPGLRLQGQSLHQFTASLPMIELPEHLPSRWARTTNEAIQSGTVYTTLAGINDFVQAWCQEFASSRIMITGGDHAALHSYLKAWSRQNPQAIEGIAQLDCDPHLVFWGIQSLRPAAT